MDPSVFDQFILEEHDKQEIIEVEMLTDYVRDSHKPAQVKSIEIDLCLQMTGICNEHLVKYMMLSYQVLLYKYTRQEDIVFGFAYEEDTLSSVRIIKSQITDETELEVNEYCHGELPEKVKLNTIYFIGYNKCDEFICIDYLFQICILNKYIKINLLYDVNIYKEETIKRFAEHFSNIIHQVTSRKDLRVKHIEIISEGEKRKIVLEFNKTKAAYPELPIHEVFEEIVRTETDKSALLYKKREVSYDELNQRANELAHKLVALGIKTEEIVGVMMDRSLEMIISIIAVLKAGGAYMPIDSEYPNERKIFMLTDSKVSILLTQKNIEPADGYIGNTIYVDVDKPLDAMYPNIEKCIAPQHLCYVMYTSGSTGNPKGVMIEHKSVVRLVKNTNYIKFNTTDRILQAAAPVFDAATFEVWGALLNGLCLCIIDKEDSLSAKKLGDIIKANGITILWLTSALFNQITEQDENIYEPLRYLLVGGDVLSVKHINRVKALHPDLIIINGYGPTENTTFSTCHIITNFYEKNIPIGKPISNTTAYILDGGNNEQPIGVPGELCFGGVGVARGYLNSKQLTREKFVDNPFVPGDIIYRTGDLGRWLSDGTIEFLGRIDSQVKIRGYRIETGEIENQLLVYKMIKEAVVIVKADDHKNKQLCAYITSDKEMTVNKLRNYLLGKIPNYMIPTYFFQVDKMPLNTSGKVDKKALLKIQGQMKTGSEYKAPRNSNESKMIKIWKDVLGICSIGISDKFLDLGGDSLTAAKICTISRENNIEVNIADILAKETIENIFSQNQKQEEELDQFDFVQNRYNLKDYKNISDIKGENIINNYEPNLSCSEKELKVVVQNEITTYLHRSLPLCALLAYENYKPWYYANYIQVFSYEDESGFIELNYLEPRDSYAEIADIICLGYHLLRKEKNIIDFIREKINMGYYLVVNLDEYELPNKKDYLKNHYVHPSIIYGYSDDCCKVKAIGFNKSRLFDKLEFNYDDLANSYESSKIHYINYAPWCAWSAIQLIKPKSSSNLFPFSIKKFLEDLRGYIYSIEDTYRLYSFEYPDTKIKYGLNVYDILVKGMRKILNGEFTIDYRALHLLAEHKKCLYDRIDYVIEHYKLGDEIKRNNELFMQLADAFNEIRLKYLGQAFVNFDINNLTQQQKQMINEVTTEIEELKEKEFLILETIYKQFIKYFQE